MNPRIFVRNTIRSFANAFRSLRRKGLDCISLPIHGSYPERTPRREPLPPPFNRLLARPAEPSLESMRAMTDMLGDDPRVETVLLRFGNLRAGMAALHSLRRMVLDLRNEGKRVVAWLPSATTWDYYLASACDEIIIPPSGRLSVLGVRLEALFVKDTLALAGVEADLESIAEYKTAPDTFRRTTMTEPHREMLDAILHSYLDIAVTAIAEGRGLDRERVREMIDEMPLLPAKALEAGLIDALLYEDEVPAYLHPGAGEGRERPPRPCTWRESARWLRQPTRRTARQTIGVVSVEGLIVPGRSRRAPAPIPLPITNAQAGADTIIQALRQAENDRQMAAVILHVDSPGGAAQASDLIAREVRRVRETKPVVALMGAQAASGGYYVAAPASRIVARPTTVTGSIGIWGGKFTLGGLYGKLGIRREALQQGAMAGLYSELAPFSPEERAWIRRDMGETYAQFKAVVAEGRRMSEQDVEQIARGRVWTGAQAHEVGLVDALGGFDTALELAKELAGLRPEQHVRAVPVRPPRHELPPPPFPVGSEGLNPATVLEALQDLARERAWALAPWIVHVRTR
jgi:protease-4